MAPGLGAIRLVRCRPRPGMDSSGQVAIGSGFYWPMCPREESFAHAQMPHLGREASPLIVKFRKSAVGIYANPPPGEVSSLNPLSSSAEALIRTIKGVDFEACRATRRVNHAFAGLKVEKSSLGIGPSARTKLRRTNNARQKKMGNFFRRQSHLLEIRGIEKTFLPF